MRSSSRPNALRSVGLLLIAATATLQIGCYRRVVGVKNAPGYNGTVYEANVDEGNEDLFKSKTVTPKGSYYLD